VTNKPVIIAPYYRDAQIFARARLGLHAHEFTFVSRPEQVRGVNLAEHRVYALRGRWPSGLRYLDMKEAAEARGAKIQWREL
jgi:hypothetical protein